MFAAEALRVDGERHDDVIVVLLHTLVPGPDVGDLVALDDTLPPARRACLSSEVSK